MYAMERGVQSMLGMVTDAMKAQQQGRAVMQDPCGCARPSHCFRTVSQRSLSVPNTFGGNQSAGAPSFPAGTNLFTALFTNLTQGALGNVPVIFNDADDNNQRRRINELVCIALRAEVSVTLFDGTPVAPSPAAGGVEFGDTARQLEEAAMMYLSLRIFHTSDRLNPWVDYTPLSFFAAPPGVYKLIPPVKWINRDPAMELSMQNVQFGAQAGSPPFVAASARDLDGTANILVEGLWVPDPDVCGDDWPGIICPSKVANTRHYAGSIQGAKVPTDRD